MTRNRARVVLSLVVAAVTLTACDAGHSLAPPAPAPIAPASRSVSAATHDRAEFDLYNDFDLDVSCVEGTTHWEGWLHLDVDIVTAPSGTVNTNFALSFAPSFFVELPDGTRYYPVAGYPTHEHHVDGPLTLIEGGSAGVFKSQDGATLPLGFHAQFVYDAAGNTVVDWKLTGVCP